MSEREVLNISQLRPLSEAGEVPEGCVRMTGYCKNGDWLLYAICLTTQDTHFADIRLPVPADKQEPETFEAHGKTWTRYTPGDPMPCDWEAMVEVCIGEDLRKRPADKAINWNWEKWTTVRGWRYADEPLVTKSEWTPQVGDVNPMQDMSLRDWFAGMALQGKATRLSNPHEHRDLLAADCYDIADAMLAARKENAQ